MKNRQGSNRQVFNGTHKKYLFNCDKCSHIFEIGISDITCNNSWCSYCSNKKLCEDSTCKKCFEKSLPQTQIVNFGVIKIKLRLIKCLNYLIKNIFLIVIYVIMNLKVH